MRSGWPARSLLGTLTAGMESGGDVLSSVGGRSMGFLAARICLPVGFLCLLVVQARGLVSFSRHQTNVDQTLLWAAGHDLIRLHLYEPNLYGSNFITTFEAIPGAVLHAFGLAWGAAFPAGTTAIVTLIWLILAGAAVYRRLYLAAVLALAIPVCLQVQYLLMFNLREGSLSGDLVASAAVASALVLRDPHRRLAVTLCLSGMAVLWDASSALATAPALMVAVAPEINRLRAYPKRLAVAAATGVVLPVAWFGWSHWFYRTHRVYVVTPPIPENLQLTILRLNLRNLGRLTSFYRPELWASHDLAVALFVFVIIAAVAVGALTRDARPALAAATLTAVVVVALSVRESVDVHPGLYLSGNRFLTTLPIGIWVVITYSLIALRESAIGVGMPGGVSWRRGATQGAVAAVALVAVTSTVVGQLRFRDVARSLAKTDSTIASVTPAIDPGALVRTCDNLATVYRQTGAQVLFTDDNIIDYGCTAQTSMNTLSGFYERRGWVIESAVRRPVTRLLLYGITCPTATDLFGTCTDEPYGLTLVVTPPRPAAATLAAMGIRVQGAELVK